MIKKCLVCKKEFITYPSKVKIGRGKYCSKKCCLKRTGIKKGEHKSKNTEFKKGRKHPWYQKGWRYGGMGKYKYIQIYVPEHPRHSCAGYVHLHRLIMEEKIGRFLTKEEVVHHINKNTLDNRPENLKLFKNSREHIKFHFLLRKQVHIKNVAKAK